MVSAASAGTGGFLLVAYAAAAGLLHGVDAAGLFPNLFLDPGAVPRTSFSRAPTLLSAASASSSVVESVASSSSAAFPVFFGGKHPPVRIP